MNLFLSMAISISIKNRSHYCFLSGSCFCSLNWLIVLSANVRNE